LPAVKLLLMHLEELKKVHRTGYIATSVNLAWTKLEEYYQLIPSAVLWLPNSAPSLLASFWPQHLQISISSF